MKVGDKRKFNDEKGKIFEIKEIITAAELTFLSESDLGVVDCPRCKEKIQLTSSKSHVIDTIEILEALDGQRIFLGFTKENIDNTPFTIRLPDKVYCPSKDMTDAIKAKSNYLK